MPSFEDISQHAGVLSAARALDTAGVVTALNGTTLQVVNAEPINSRTIIRDLGPTDAGTAMVGFKAAASGSPLLDGIWIAINTTGINFADPITQSMLTSMIEQGVFTSDLGAKLKALGIKTLSLAERWYGRQATEDDAREIIATVRQRDTFDTLRSRFNATVAYLDAHPTATVAECIAKFGE